MEDWMHSAHRSWVVLRRRIGFALFSGLLGVMLMGLTQCRMVDDTITGVGLQTESSLHGRGSDCTKRCNREFKKAKREEDGRYRKAKHACHGKKDCRKKVEREHQRILNKLTQEKRACKRACYNEGAGGIGR